MSSNHQHLRMYVLYILVACMSRCSTLVLEDNQFSFCPASSHLSYCITWICTNLCIYISAKREVKSKEMTIRCLHQGSAFTLLIRDANTNFPLILLCNMLHANTYVRKAIPEQMLQFQSGLLKWSLGYKIGNTRFVWSTI